jgi:sn-glycerol 3-phosphate transport system permease protein
LAAVDLRMQSPSRRRGSSREYLLFIAFVAPNFLLLGAFSYWPLIYQSYLSLTRWDMISPTKTFVGLDNYRYMVSGREFYQVLFNTFYFTGAVLLGSIVLGLALAVLLNQRLRWRVAARAVIFAPYVLSGAAIGLVWAYIFDPVYGLMRILLGLFGLGSPTGWSTRHGRCRRSSSCTCGRTSATAP